MKNVMRSIGLVSVLTLALGNAIAQESKEPIRIGTISDLTGTYSGLAGPGIAVAMELAVEDFGGKLLGRDIEVLSVDSLQKADVSTSKAREWIDQRDVQFILESSDSASALALQQLVKEKKRIAVFTSGSTAIINDHCTPYGMQWAWNTHALSNVAGKALTKNGNEKWYFITADYTFGKILEEETTKVVTDMGGEVVGVSRHPFKNADYGSFLLSAQSAKPDVLALANAGQDTQNTIRQAKEFGLMDSGIVVAPLILFDSDVKGMGLDLAQGLQFVTAFYWDQSDESREWSERFYKIRKSMPTMNQAGAYSATLHYLRSVEAANTLDPDEVMNKMREIPVNDFFVKDGIVRKDGLMEHDMYLAEVKTPSESTGEWDMLKILQRINSKDAFSSLEESTCALVN